jgi:NADPH:quinone reductase-like Zn-dependent oxidoreductase
MRALRLTEFGDLDRLQLEDLPLSELGPDDCLVRIRAAAINPSDVKNVQGSMSSHTRLPRTPGRDFAGTVEKGPDSMVGRDVYGSGGDLGFTRDGAHAEYIVVPSAALSVKPANLSFEEAASVGTPFVTAWEAIVSHGEVEPDERVAVWGAAGSVGSAACQIVRAHGARAVGIVLPGETAEEADESTSAPEELRDIDMVLNVIGGATFGTSLAMLANHGRQVLISTNRDKVQELDLLDFYRRNLRLLGLNTLLLNSIECAEILHNLKPGFEAGTYHVKSPRAMPLSQAIEAYKRVASTPGEKLVLQP